ncbi:MAG: hypothetical protein OXF89_15900 [Rhodospirillaceae bacterium]|nr:hypothetical protein [Rhodospirillaceae bacterium]MCY4066729.1 hypothetical protein [Rhodospirillaceae bacterium]
MTTDAPMFVPPSDLDPVERAMGYPYAIPDCSFVFDKTGGDKTGWRPAEIGGALTAGRHPVIACGSNRSPDQLARKYFDFDAATIPVQRAWLRGFDVVYAAHITGYGAISACPMPAPGVRVEVSVVWLSDDLMDRMHATEGRGHAYDYAVLSGLDLALDGGGGLDEAFAYIHRGGALNVGGGTVGLAEVAATGRACPSWLQPRAIAEVLRRLEYRGTVEDFIRENAADRVLRLAREAVLQQDAHPFAYGGCRVVPPETG